MTTAGAAPASARPSPADRGRLRIADRVHSRIATCAVQRALADAWAGRAERGAPPRVSVLVLRGKARLTMHLELPFPSRIGALARIARDAAAGEVERLTGIPVTEVAVHVARLIPVEVRGE